MAGEAKRTAVGPVAPYQHDAIRTTTNGLMHGRVECYCIDRGWTGVLVVVKCVVQHWLIHLYNWMYAIAQVAITLCRYNRGS